MDIGHWTVNLVFRYYNRCHPLSLFCIFGVELKTEVWLRKNDKFNVSRRTDFFKKNPWPLTDGRRGAWKMTIRATITTTVGSTNSTKKRWRENGHIPISHKKWESPPLKRGYLENPCLCIMVGNNLYFLRSCVWFLSVARRLGRKECRINRCPIVVMATVPILGTKFAFGGPFGHLPQTPTLIGSLAYPVSSSSQSRCYLLGIQKGADGSVSVRHN